MQVVVIPTFKCNFSCSFCSQKIDKHKAHLLMDLDKLKFKLASMRGITSFRLKGGEISILPDDYLDSLMSLLESYNVRINILTNLYNIPERIKNYDLIVGFNFDEKFHHDRVIQNMLMLNQFSISTVVSKKLIQRDVEDLNNFYGSFQNLNAVHFNFYKLNEMNGEESTTPDEYIEFLLKLKNTKLKFKVANFSTDDVAEMFDDIVIDPDLSISERNSKTTEDGTIIRFSDCDNCNFRNICCIRTSHPQDDYTKCKMREILSE